MNTWSDTARERWDALVRGVADAVEHHEAQRRGDELAECLAAADAARAIAPVRLPSRDAVHRPTPRPREDPRA